MKFAYEKPEMTVTLFETEDIITTSTPALYDGLQENPLGTDVVDDSYNPDMFT